MKKYRVTACYRTYCTAVVEADTAEQAEAIAEEMDGGDFKESGELGDWQIVHAEEITDGITTDLHRSTDSANP
jgi:hypothetical protein